MLVLVDLKINPTFLKRLGFYLYNYTTGHAARRGLGALQGPLDALGSACDRAKAASTASYRASP
jgi:hypothetical protein